MNYPDWFVILFLFLVGSVIGSFMNVCIYRLPKDLSVVKPRSFCPACKTVIAWYQNIPIISYAVLNGRCSHCSERISPLYPFVEALNGVFYVVLFLMFGISLELLLYAPFVSALVVLFFIDYKEKILPDKITIPGFIFGIGLSPVVQRLGVLNSLMGAAIGFAFFYCVAFIYEKMTGREGMGGGDIKMIAMIGAVLGVKGVIATIFIASCAGAITGILLIIFFQRDLRYAVPFGSFISAGALIYLFIGERLISLYFLSLEYLWRSSV